MKGRNFYENIESNAELMAFLSGFGVDFFKTEEIFYYDLGSETDSLINYNAYYCIDGYISDEISLKKEGYICSFIKNYNANVGR